MFRGLRRSFLEMYSFIGNARGICTEEEIRKIVDAAAVMAEKAEKVIPWETRSPMDAEDARDLDEVKLIQGHIEEMMVFQLSQEIV